MLGGGTDGAVASWALTVDSGPSEVHPLALTRTQIATITTVLTNADSSNLSTPPRTPDLLALRLGAKTFQIPAMLVRNRFMFNSVLLQAN